MICGHIYDPEKGDTGIAQGIAFESVPADWCCPVCGAEKNSLFQKSEQESGNLKPSSYLSWFDR